MGYKENRKREAERWGEDSNNRIGRQRWRQTGKTGLVGSYGMPFVTDHIETVTEPQYLYSVGDNRALKITQALLDEIKTRWLICQQPHDFKVSGMIYYTDQIKSDHKRRILYVGGNLEVTTICVNPKRGVWRVFIKNW
ncbi:hypothetical protein PP754_gp022 [Pectobacterium phage Possum]|uniref:Uncharacterized protein n=1 Tax=Pectobacterium phage Possum TaxID=2686301 RepID=A0A7T0LVP4_9CAUD|nr:hypothetical protein PP754_gp022 [Pectobacterium phage Possum]QPL10863.1 hypothetical protein Possum_00022 [Pectobacterium phage Possum]QPL10965.1 hypothetical protein Horatius_00022 [Pectobacterium phage Horatius]